MSSRFSNFSTGNDNNALLSTGEFLRFTGEDNTATFVPGVATVRSATHHLANGRESSLPSQSISAACLWGQHSCRSGSCNETDGLRRTTCCVAWDLCCLDVSTKSLLPHAEWPVISEYLMQTLVFL